MNDFVNPHDREIDLPEGCKDLLDFLHLKKASTEKPEPDVRPEGFADIESYMWRMLEPSAWKRHLSICCWQHAEKHLLTLIRPKGVLRVLIPLRCESVQEAAMRSLIEQEGIILTQDAVIGEAGKERRFLYFPVPGIAPQAARLVSEILRKVCGLQEDAKLEFHYSVRGTSVR